MAVRFYKYSVQSRTTSGFPYDMLRHDQAWPWSTDDVLKLANVDLARPGTPESTITLLSNMPPTPARWATFGWRVTMLNGA